jgi:hypothetical protein
LSLQLILFAIEQSHSNGHRTVSKAEEEAISIITKSDEVDSMIGDIL